MIYTASIETTFSTSEANAKVTEIKVTDGVIHEVSVYFPSGCAGLVYCQIFEGGHQFVPSTEGQFLRGDGILIDSKEFYEIDTAPRWITVKTWNLDDTYNHTIEIMIKQLPKYVLLPAGAYEGIIYALKSLVLRGLAV
jgi:hypothetical protein